MKHSLHSRLPLLSFFTCVFVALLLCNIANADISGQCGDTLTYTLTDDGTLTITGTGPMWN